MRKLGLLMLAAAGSLAAGNLDGARVYRNNCTRCHIVMPAFSAKTTRVIVRHMRVRAELTKPEADAVLAFLTGNAASAARH